MQLRRNRRSLQRRLFVWFGVTIVATLLAVGAVFGFLGPGSARWRANLEGAEQLLGDEFANVWAEPQKRQALAERIARAFDIDITLEDD
ncbi:MAG TPA: hypothetical protein VGP93_05420, partial [Polyangiaceae bacterium]|nr:hypothetical protein [Polyangiaceae bacterium]